MSYNVHQKQSGMLGLTCRDSYVADDCPDGSKGGGGCPGSRMAPQQQPGWNMGSPGLPQGSCMSTPGLPQGSCMGSPGLPQGSCMGGPPGLPQGSCMGGPPGLPQGSCMGSPGSPQGWNPMAGPGGWVPTCNCDESDTETSSSSGSSSSDSSAETKVADKKAKSREQLANPNISPWYNYEFCTCDATLPDAYVPKPKPKKKSPVAGPQAGIWCGSPCCAVAEYFPPKGKNIVLNPLQLKLKETSSAVPPGTCCFRNDQLIFQVPNKGHKSDSEVLPFYNVGPDEKPLGVKMMRPEENPELDPGNNTFLIKITKTDAKGKPAKMQLALKIPRQPDTSVPENETSVQYKPEDLLAGRTSMGGGGRKSKGGKKSTKSVAWSKTTTKRRSTKSTRTKTSKVSKGSKVKFSGIKKLTKEIKKAGKK